MRITSYRAGEAGDFAFTPETKKSADAIIARYPEGREASATIALLDLAQRQVGGWLTDEAIEYVANYLGVAPIRVHEVAAVRPVLLMADALRRGERWQPAAPERPKA